MQTLKSKSGESIEFTPLVYDEKNLIKVNLTNDEDDLEGIWAVVSEADKKDLDNDKQSGTFVAMLANNALNFPFASWGLHIICKHRGTSRPVADTTWVDYEFMENRIYSPDVALAEEEENDEAIES